MELIAERGFAGTSLRELARRLNVQQPSLYTYFESKDELLTQIIDHVGAEILYGTPPESMPSTLDEIPAWTVELVMKLYNTPAYSTFLRLLFTVGAEHEHARDAMRRLYTDGFTIATRLVAQPFVEAGEITADDAEQLMRMITHAIGLSLIEHRVLYAEPRTPASVREFADWLVEFATTALESLRRRARSRTHSRA